MQACLWSYTWKNTHYIEYLWFYSKICLIKIKWKLKANIWNKLTTINIEECNNKMKKRKKIVQKQTPKKKKKPCWRMLEDVCYGKSWNFQTYTLAKKMQGRNTNLEFQRASIKHNKKRTMNNNRTEQRNVDKQQGLKRYLNTNNNKGVPKITNRT